MFENRERKYTAHHLARLLCEAVQHTKKFLVDYIRTTTYDGTWLWLAVSQKHSIDIYSSAGISCELLALTNLACKLVVVFVISSELSLRFSCDTSVSTWLPSANAWAHASHVLGTIWLRKCSSGPFSSKLTLSTSSWQYFCSLVWTILIAHVGNALHRLHNRPMM